MDIVDTQLHLGRDKIEETLAQMDALGIQSVLIDEFWGSFSATHPTHIAPGYLLPNGAWRTAFPTAEIASICHPDRFAYLVRIDPRDPQLESVMRSIASTPHVRAFRLQPAWTAEEMAAFGQGSYNQVLELAQDIGLPVCIFVPGFVELLTPYVEKFSRLKFVIDHCGMGFPNIPHGRPNADANRATHPDYLDEVCKLAAFPNTFVKWSHAQNLLNGGEFPYEPLKPLLRKMIHAFGASRLMWASDNTVIPNHTWSETLRYIRDDGELMQDEKTWILGRTARHVFNWKTKDASIA